MITSALAADLRNRLRADAPFCHFPDMKSRGFHPFAESPQNDRIRSFLLRCFSVIKACRKSSPQPEGAGDCPGNGRGLPFASLINFCFTELICSS